MVFVPDVYPLPYRGEFGLWLHTNGTRLRDPAEWCYATLGGVDLVMIADLPDNARAFAASAALAKSTGIAFTTAPAVTIEEFDKLAG